VLRMRLFRHPINLSYFLLAIPLLIWLPWLGYFAYPPNLQSSDLVISHWPNALYIARTLQRYGEVPFWSDLILGGYPFVADPLSGLWYPPGWITILMPSALGFNLALLLHFYWLGLGTFQWLRGQGYSPSPALLGAWVMMLFPKLIAHWAAGHVTLLYAFCWTPWVFLAEDRRHESAKMTATLLPGIVLGMAWLADLRWGAILGLCWLGYALVRNRKQLWPLNLHWKRILVMGLQPVWASMISAPLLLPLLEWLPLTTRASLRAEEAAIFSITPVHLLGLLFPGFVSYHELITYLGMIPLMMVTLAIAIPSLRRRLKGWLLGAVIAWIFAMGPSLPLWPLLARMPGLDLLRVPSRAWFMVGWVAAICTAAGSEWLMKRQPFFTPGLRLWMVGLLAFQMLIGPALVLLWSKALPSVVYGSISLLISMGLLIAAQHVSMPTGLLQAIMGVLLLGDLALSAPFWISFRSPEWVKTEGIEVANFIARDARTFRVYSPSYSIPQHTSALTDLELASGIDPLQLRTFAGFMERASGIPILGYSVTLPPLEGEDPRTVNRNYRPNPEMLGWFNVRYIVSDFELPVEGLVERAQFGETRIYENLYTFPRAWLQNDLEWPPRVDREVEIIYRSPNAWRLRAQGPGWMIVAEVAYPGWQVILDDHPWMTTSINDLFRATYVPPGEHEVDMVFRPRYLWPGVVLAVGVWLTFIIGIVLESRRSP